MIGGSPWPVKMVVKNLIDHLGVIQEEALKSSDSSKIPVDLHGEAHLRWMTRPGAKTRRRNLGFPYSGISLQVA